MEDNSSYGSYEENEEKNPLIKIILIILAIIVIIVVIFLVMRSCSGNSLENNLLTAGKSYYDDNTNNLPESVGECNTVTLKYLVEQEFITDVSNYNSCDDSATYVKVCKLESGNYHYVPVIQCGTNDDTIFGDYVEGNESDLVEDKSDVRFTYIGEIYSTQAKAYYPSNTLDASEVNELYISAPSTEYTYKGDSVENASKWYTETTGTSYWNNGAYSSTAPSGYPNQGKEGTATTKISLTAPSQASYRVIEQKTIYRTRNVSSPVAYRFLCFSRTLNGDFVSTTPCAARADSYTEYKKIYYTCDGSSDVERTDTCPNTEWSAWTTTACKTEGIIECESKNGYVYTDKTWQWYVTGNYKSYYPSGSATADGENTYYVSSPKDGYVKDEATTTTAYKYYKLTDDVLENSNQGEWTKLSDDYLELEELLNVFKEKGFEVTSLADITENEEIRYSIKLEYANRQ